MEIWKLLLLGIVIGSNNLAVAFALGALNVREYWWRIIITFGLFEFSIPLLGILIGRQFSHLIADYASLVGGSILILLGVFVIIKSLTDSDQNKQNLNYQITTWTGIISLSAGLSLDNLILGFSIGLGGFHPLTTAAVIAGSSILFTIFGLNFGKYLKDKFRTWTEIAAAVLLIIIGITTVFDMI